MYIICRQDAVLLNWKWNILTFTVSFDFQHQFRFYFGCISQNFPFPRTWTFSHWFILFYSLQLRWYIMYSINVPVILQLMTFNFLCLNRHIKYCFSSITLPIIFQIILLKLHIYVIKITNLWHQLIFPGSFIQIKYLPLFTKVTWFYAWNFTNVVETSFCLLMSK